MCVCVTWRSHGQESESVAGRMIKDSAADWDAEVTGGSETQRDPLQAWGAVGLPCSAGAGATERRQKGQERTPWRLGSGT